MPVDELDVVHDKTRLILQMRQDPRDACASDGEVFGCKGGIYSREVKERNGGKGGGAGIAAVTAVEVPRHAAGVVGAVPAGHEEVCNTDRTLKVCFILSKLVGSDLSDGDLCVVVVVDVIVSRKIVPCAVGAILLAVEDL